MICDRYKEGLAFLAQGQASPAATAHVAMCPDCAWRLKQMKRIVAMLREPEAEGVDAGGRTKLEASLIGGGPGSSGARRRDVSEFALHVGVEDFSLRIAYTSTETGWEVLGRAPDANWCVLRNGVESRCGVSGRFRFLAPTLGDTRFTLRSDEIDVDVPSAREMVDFGP